MGQSGEPDDPTLVQGCLAGEDAAWRALVRRYTSLVYTTALRMGLDADAAQEVYQQVWTELHRSLARVRDPQALPKWLMVATRRLAYRHALQRDRWVDGTFEEMVDPALLPDAEVEQLELRRRVDVALDRLDGSCGQLLRLLFLHAPPLSYDEVALRADLPRGSIGPMRARCLERLRAELGGRT